MGSVSKQTFNAQPGTKIVLYDASGSEEVIDFGESGQVSTDNPLWLRELEKAVAGGRVSKGPRPPAPKKRSE